MLTLSIMYIFKVSMYISYKFKVTVEGFQYEFETNLAFSPKGLLENVEDGRINYSFA